MDVVEPSLERTPPGTLFGRRYLDGVETAIPLGGGEEYSGRSVYAGRSWLSL